jgi:hypothetical protein
MFDGQVTLRGLEATVLWGYHTAAVIRSWTVVRTPEGQWSLQAQVQRADPFQLRQRPLKFTAPRVGGYFCWPVLSATLGAGTLAAVLGPPES